MLYNEFMLKNRYLTDYIVDDLKDKMVFVGGPRQVGNRAELYFLRDVDKREVDFLVTINDKPWFAVEAKLGETSLSPSLLYFKDRLSIPYITRW